MFLLDAAIPGEIVGTSGFGIVSAIGIACITAAAAVVILLLIRRKKKNKKNIEQKEEDQ